MTDTNAVRRRPPKLKITIGTDNRMWWLRSGKSHSRKRCGGCAKIEHTAYMTQCEWCDGLMCSACIPRILHLSILRNYRQMRQCRSCAATD